MIETTQDITAILAQMAQSLQQIAMAMTPNSEISKPISEYLTFDWPSIGAKVLREDEDGPSIVEWNGQVYKRRAPDNQFGACIWFSRCIGKDGDGKNKYESLICFSEIKDDVQPLGRKAKKLVEASRQERRPAAQSGSRSASASAATEPAPKPAQDDEAAAQEQAHRKVEAEMKQVYLALGKTEAEWTEFYAEKDIYNLSLPIKREKLEGMKAHAKQKGVVIPLKRPSAA